MKKQIKVVDLFAGPGGLGEGFSSLKVNGIFPFKLVVSVEKEKSAHETLTLRAFIREFKDRKPPNEYYKFLSGEITKEELFDIYHEEYERAKEETLKQPRELGKKEDDKYINQAIKNRISKNEKWVLIGGPPCQAYSLVGRARNAGIKGYKAEEDHRHFLYKEYLRILKEFKPYAFVMENVQGILSSKVNGELVFPQIQKDLEKCGYSIYSFSTKPNDDLPDHKYSPQDFLIKAEKYGIPQIRRRVILLGVKKGIKINTGQILLDESDAPTVKQMIGDFPKLRSGISKQEDSDEEWKKIIRKIDKEIYRKTQPKNWPKIPKEGRGSEFVNTQNFLELDNKNLEKFIKDKSLEAAINHSTRSHIANDLARYYYASDFTKDCLTSPKLEDFPAHLLPKHKNVKSGKFVDRFKVQAANKPSNTITSHISKDGHYFIHYDPMQCRSLTVREAARLQTFPDNYYFCGNRTQQYVQVGNAVPPFLAIQLAEKLIQQLESFKPRSNQ